MSHSARMFIPVMTWLLIMSVNSDSYINRLFLFCFFTISMYPPKSKARSKGMQPSCS